METFTLQGRDYIELNKLLKLMHLVSTGGEANMAIEQGEVLVNGQVEFRKRNKLRTGMVVEFRGRRIEVRE